MKNILKIIYSNIPNCGLFSISQINFGIYRNIPYSIFLRKVCPGYFSGVFQTNYRIPEFPNLYMSRLKFGIFWDIPWKMEYSRFWLICMSQNLKWNIPKISNKKSMLQGRVKLRFVFKGISLYLLWIPKFLTKSYLCLDSFLKGFLYILRFSEFSFGLQFGTKIWGFL